MTMEVKDVVQVGIPGSAGTVTPAAQAALAAGELARDAAIAAQEAAEFAAEHSGNLASATAVTLSPDAPATVVLEGPLDARNARFGIPRGLPGVNAVENDAAVATYLRSEGTQARQAASERIAAEVAGRSAKAVGAGLGAANDSPLLQALLDVFDNVVIPAGTYNIGTPLVIPRSGQTITFAAGTKLKAQAGLGGLGVAMLSATGRSEVTVVGNGVIFDMNAVTDRAIRIMGTSSANVDGIRVSGVKAINAPSTADGSAAIEFRYVNSPDVVGIEVRDYGYATTRPAGDGWGYGLGFFFCTDVKTSRIRLINCDVGLEIQACDDVQASLLTIRGCRDNGIYILSNSTSVNISQSRIDACEEGVVVRSDDVTLDRVKITNCTNKGVSLRVGQRVKITRCHFQGNATHIGDAGATGGTVSRGMVCGNTFKDSTAAAIFLVLLTDSDICGNSFDESLVTDHVIRVNNALRVRINENRFDNPGKTAANTVRVAGSSVDCEVARNTFVVAATAINIYDSGALPTGTRIIHNLFRDVTTQIALSGGVLAQTVRVPIVASALNNFGFIAAGASASFDMNVPSAAVGDRVILNPPNNPDGIVFQAFVSAIDTVTVRARNVSGASIDPDPASSRYRVEVG